MIYDYKNKKVEYENPGERVDYERHMAEFGPAKGIPHPKDCEYCKSKGWKNYQNHEEFLADCEKWAKEHPDEV